MKKLGETSLEALFLFVAQTSLLVNFVQHSKKAPTLLSSDAKRPENIRFFVHRDAADPFWRNGVDATLLQAVETPLAPAELYHVLRTQRRLRASRSHDGAALCDCRGTAPHQQNRTASVQRHVCRSGGIESFSRPIHAAPFFAAAADQIHSPVGRSARPVANSTLPGSQRSHQLDLRPRLGCADPLRPSARSPRWLQSQEERPPLLPPAALLRGLSSGVLARFAATGRY